MPSNVAVKAAPAFPRAGGISGAAVANRLAAALMAATVCFNAVLAFVNGHLFTLNSGMVAAVQAVLVFGAVGVALLAQPAGLARWVVYAWATLLLSLVLMLLRSTLDPKAAADVLTVPAFAALGLCLRRDTLMRTLIVLQILLVAFAVYELFFPTSFGELFKVRDYYVATRGFKEEAFWAGEDNLFLSSQRPDGRLLNIGLGINRGSSLFLEPVTLGNWTVVVAIALAAFFRDLDRRTKAVLLITNLLLLIACDGRLALASGLAILLTMRLASRLPRFVPVLYLPGMFFLMLALMAVGAVSTEAGYDTLFGRYVEGTEFLTSINVSGLLGLNPDAATAADSGWTYVTLRQSIFGLAALWFAVTLMVPWRGEGKRFVHGAALFMALGLPVSYSIVSIKMAAAFWMIAGCVTAGLLAARDEGADAGKPELRPSPARLRHADA